MTASQKRIEQIKLNNIETNKKLCEEMPYLAIKNVRTGKISEDYEYSYTEIDNLPKGWRNLFLQYCRDIKQPLIDNNYLDKFRFSQVKEKYGAMRCYNFGSPKEVAIITEKYEYISQFVCQECGAPATKMTNGWVTSYCDDCFKWKNWDIDEDSYEEIEFNPIYVKEIYCNGVSEKIEVNCNSIWERYLGIK